MFLHYFNFSQAYIESGLPPQCHFILQSISSGGIFFPEPRIFPRIPIYTSISILGASACVYGASPLINGLNPGHFVSAM
jgi:hypothetical protein